MCPIFLLDEFIYLAFLSLQGTKFTLEFLVRFLAKLHPLSDALQLNLIRRMVAALRHEPESKFGLLGILSLDIAQNIYNIAEIVAKAKNQLQEN